MAEELHKRDSLVLVGAGHRGKDPIIVERNGHPFRGFLEGRTQNGKYLLVLHLSSLELYPTAWETTYDHRREHSMASTGYRQDIPARIHQG